jgi:hypothetical protein
MNARQGSGEGTSPLLCAAIIPLAIGIIRAQTLPPPPAYTYEVVSIHRSSPDQRRAGIGGGPQGGLRMQNVTAMDMLTFPYGIRDYQIVGAPGWASSEHLKSVSLRTRRSPLSYPA